MVHTIYVNYEEFENVIVAHECDVETFLIDPEMIAGDYVIFIDKETKERTMLKVLSSDFTERRTLKEKLNVKSNDDALIHIVGNRKELELKKIKYKIQTEECTNIISMPMNLNDDEFDEFMLVVVNEKGIYAELKNKRFSFTKKKTNTGQNICEALTDTHYATLRSEEELIPLIDYSNKIGNETKHGRVYLLQESVETPMLSLITPSKISTHMISETFAFGDMFSRYLFWILENLYKHEDLPEHELGIKDEPQDLGEILNNRMCCLTDLTDVDYNDFEADNFLLYVQPYLTKSQQRERTKLIPKNERNYIEVMELIYEEAFLEWALEYDEERTKQDERYKRIYG